ncbi:HU family DNA-binding protein [uncultured Psychrobacter sp.]|uniref:HU family DNA-binding protein n=1 Tax=uncultured Psychrobacter sp. TaxID=259303 RepID=UPI0025979298|nr:HU family DNA-binding protein [uncultured Psychrobacter sp.]
MNKQDLINVIAEETQITQTKAKEVLECTLSTIGVALMDGDDVRLIGFGTFKTSERKARTGRNPKTGEELQIPAKTAVTFSAGKTLKDAVN